MLEEQANTKTNCFNLCKRISRKGWRKIIHSVLKNVPISSQNSRTASINYQKWRTSILLIASSRKKQMNIIKISRPTSRLVKLPENVETYISRSLFHGEIPKSYHGVLRTFLCEGKRTLQYWDQQVESWQP